MVEEAVATVAAAGMVEALAAGMVEASAAGMASVVAVILALVGGMAIGRKAKKPWIGSAIMGADLAVSFGINQLGFSDPWKPSISRTGENRIDAFQLSGSWRDDRIQGRLSPSAR
jgi:phage-related minor tail protein